MKNISLKSVMMFSFVTSILLVSCSKEEDTAFLTPSSNSSSNVTQSSGIPVTHLLTLQDFAARGTLTVNNSPTFEPNAASYGYTALNWVPNAGISPVTTIYQFNPNLPGSANPLPPNSPLSVEADGTFSDTFDNDGNRVYECSGPAVNCASDLSGGTNEIVVIRRLAPGAGFGGLL